MLKIGCRTSSLLWFGLLFTMILVFSSSSYAATYTVSKTADTNDGVCNADCSLREAITAANGGSGNIINFSINGTTDGGCTGANGICTITPTSALPNITGASMTINGYSQYAASANTNAMGNVTSGFSALNTVLRIVIDGTSAGAGVDGLTINNVAGVTIKGLNIRRFADEGITITGASATGAKIQGCFIGTDYTGETDQGNIGNGIEVNTSATVIIGSDGDGVNDAAERNLISGNNAHGILISGTTGSMVSGNFIGTDKDGTVDLGNTTDGINATASTTTIGTNGDGTADSAEGNLISGNDGDGIDNSGTNVVIAGNIIGINLTGNAILANTTHGVYQNSTGGLVGTNADGTSDTYERNVITGNTGHEVGIANSSNTVAGNYLGTGINGTLELNSNGSNIEIASANSNLIGTDGDGINDAAEVNYLCGSSNSSMMQINSGDTNTVAGNYIGVNAATSSCSNAVHGIYILGDSDNNTIGGDIAAEANYIAYNGNASTEYGIYVSANNADGNQFIRNIMHSNFNKGIALASGGNNDQAAPSISTTTPSGTNTDITGTSTASDVVQVFLASAEQGSATLQEGYTYLGQTTADGSGNWTLTVATSLLTTGVDLIAATTDAVNGTSEFSAVYQRNATYTVTKTADTNDGTCDADCSLREAITAANVGDGNAIEFNIPGGTDGGCTGAGGVCTITPTSALPEIVADSMTINAYTQTGAAVNSNAMGDVTSGFNALDATLKIVIDGVSAGSGVDGLSVNGSDGLVIKGFNIQRFNGDGIQIANSTATVKIQGCYIGTDVSGELTTRGNGGHGIHLSNSGVTAYIGTDGDGSNDTAERNLISANGAAGIYSANASTIIIAGNFIGTDKDGTNDLGNGSNGGIFILSYPILRVGTDGNGVSDNAEGNLIAGNTGYGMYSSAAASVVAGNIISLDRTGMAALANTNDSYFNVGNSNRLGTNADGTSDTLERNVIAGGASNEVYFNTGDSNTIAGNYIGTGLDGSTAISSVGQVIGIGGGGSGNRIGTNGDGVNDTIEANVLGCAGGSACVYFDGADSNVVAGNYIGTNSLLSDLGSPTYGVQMNNDSDGNLIGGDIAAEANIIAYNGDAVSEYGILVNHANADGNRFLRNRYFSNQDKAVHLITGGNNNKAAPSFTSAVINGTNTEFNGTATVGDVVQLYAGSSETNGASIQDPEEYLGEATADGSGNWMISVPTASLATGRTLLASATDLTNGTSQFSSYSRSATFTVTKTADTNDGTCDADCSLREAITAANYGSGNTIEFNIPGGTDGGCTGAGGLCTITPSSALPTIVGNSMTLNGYTQSGSAVNSNVMGSVLTGFNALNTTLTIAIKGDSAGAGVHGLSINHAASTTIKGLNIRNFGGDGIYFSGSYSTNNTVQGCFIGTDHTGESDQGNTGTGITLTNSADGIIGTNGDGSNDASERNLISGNNANGIYISNTVAAISKISGNFIGTNKGGTADIGNATNGIHIPGATYTQVGTNGDGTADDVEGNLIAGNDDDGIQYDGTSHYTNIAGNLIGTQRTGLSALANASTGISFSADNSRIGTNSDGTSDTLERNVVAGNTSMEVSFGSGSSLTTFSGNYVGLGTNGTTTIPSAGASVQLFVSDSNTIGTNGDGVRDSAEANYICSSNNSNMVQINGSDSNVVAGNFIGVTTTLTDCGAATHGINFSNDADNNIIGGDIAAEANTIAYNGDAASEYGIAVQNANADGNQFLRNIMYSNQDLGIAITAAGGNNDQAAPSIVSRSSSGTTLTLTGTSAASDIIQIFDASSDNEGETYLSQVYANGAGAWTATFAKSAFTAETNVLVATTTSTTNGTSPFSSAYTLSSSTPGVPTSLGPTEYVNGSNVTDTSPTVQFNIDDPDNDSVSFRIQFDDNSDFSSPIIDYTSALSAEGTRTYTPGDTGGTYNVGTQFTRLPYGSIYWRVKSIDFFDDESAYTTANGGAVAFVVRVYSVNKTADTNDGTCNTDCSLREAITAANADATYYTVEFAIDPDVDVGCNAATDVCTITPASNLTTITRAGMTINGYSQYGSSVTTQNFPAAIDAIIKIGIDGTSAGLGSDGFTINASNVTIKGLSIYNYVSNASADAVRTTAGAAISNISIQGNFIGVKPDGTTGAGNYMGIVAQFTGSNFYIGTNGDGSNDASERNLLSGNTRHAVYTVQGSNIYVSGNYIGSDSTGLSAVSNSYQAINAAIASTYIGTNGDGSNDSYEGNLISGNAVGAVLATNNVYASGNYIGLNRTGTVALANSSYGIYITADGPLIGTNSDGTSDQYERNFISGNSNHGIYAIFAGTTNITSIRGNYIGLGVDGTTVVANSVDGINISTVAEKVVVGTNGDGVNDSIEGNYICGNTNDGIEVGDQNNTIAGNTVGINPYGTDCGNGQHGILLSGASADSITIGGDATAEGNSIAYNGDAASEYGVYLNNASTDGNSILRNSFYSNQNEGIKLASGANNDQPVPVIVQHTGNGLGLNLAGTTSAGAKIQLFDASGDNEGQTFAGEGTADGSGNWSVTLSSPYDALGNSLVATSTDSTNGTSQFSSVYTITNSSPNAPSALGPSLLVDGSSTTDATPSMTFSLSDPNTSDTIRYRIQIDDTSSFASPVIDYTSALQVQGAATYTVGQTAGTGSYTVGSAGSVLQKGSYYWRVSAVDYFSAVSSDTTANAGAVAFVESNYTVNVTADETGTCNTSCSLREAIAAANGSSGNTVQFEIPSTDANCSVSGVCTISPASVLPDISAASMTIDGYTQTGASVNTNATGNVITGINGLNAAIKIAIDGTSAGGAADGLTVNNVGSVTIKGLNVRNFHQSGIVVTGASATGTKIQGCYIGTDETGLTDQGNGAYGIYMTTSATSGIIGTDSDGTNDAAERNLISGNTSSGIRISTASGRISGNLIGTNATGLSALPNTVYGVYITSGTVGTNRDGTHDDIEGNLISGNTSAGIHYPSGTVTTAGNIIGLNGSGTGALPNLQGINANGSSGHRIGTNADGTSDSYERNVISGNTTQGIYLNSGTTGNTVAGNYIGTGLDGSTDYGNGDDGIAIVLASIGHTIGGTSSTAGNIIAYNGNVGTEYGIFLGHSNTDGISILTNSFFLNSGIGINLNTGSNNNQPKPVFVSRTSNGVNIDISGTSSASATVQLFDASTDGEGQTYIGEDTADGSGVWTITVPPPYTSLGNTLVATSTDATNGTSEFSATHTLSNSAPSAPSSLGPTLVVNGSTTTDATPTFNFTLSDSDASEEIRYRIQIDDTASFASPVIDYTSALQVQGSATYTVGQAAGSGSYTVGAEGDVLQKESYYWRVQAIDSFASVSAQSTANGGAVAFIESAYTVNTTGDGSVLCDNTCTLREAIVAANALSNSVVQFSIEGSVDSGCTGSGGVCTIYASSALPTITQSGMTINGYTQSGASYGTQNYPNAIDSVIRVGLSGSSLSSGEYGLTINTTGATITGLSIYDFPSHGIFITNTVGNSSNNIQGNYVGVRPDGETSDGNGGSGIRLDGTNVTGTIIGTDGDGTNDARERNVISGNTNHGIHSFGASTTVKGNFIGTNKLGSTDVGNSGSGVYGENGSLTIGTDGNGNNDSYEGNLISGNNSHGSYIGSSCQPAVIAGNIIGLNSGGTVDRGNTSNGIDIGNVTNLRVGTNGDGVSDTYERNIISGNDGSGVAFGVLVGTTVIAGNYIGTDISGLLDVGNTGPGVYAWGGQSSVYIGTNGDGTGDASEGNVISGNDDDGINIFQGTPNVRGNYIGLGSDGTTALGNSDKGIHCNAVPSSLGTNSDGVSDALEGNYISNNGDIGIYIPWNLSNISIKGNKIGVTSAGSDAGNGNHGIKIESHPALPNNNYEIGGAGPYDGNIIAYNGNAASEYGLYFESDGADGHDILFNDFHNNHDKGIELHPSANNGQSAPTIDSSSCSGNELVIVGTAGGSNTIQLFVADSDAQEGQTYLGYGYSDVTGNWRVKVPSGTGTVVATATDATDGTSEFSSSFLPGLTCTGRRRVIIIQKQSL